jgi:hypothetical protein
MAAVVVPGGIAGAAAKTLTCTSLTGSGTATKQTIAISGCSGTGSSQTGSAGTSTVTTNIATKKGTATISWTKTKKTTTESYSYVEDTGSKNTCAAKSGYSKLAMAVEKGTVTGGTATGLKTGAVTATVCAYSKSGKIYIFNKGPVKM